MLIFYIVQSICTQSVILGLKREIKNNWQHNLSLFQSADDFSFYTFFKCLCFYLQNTDYNTYFFAFIYRILILVTRCLDLALCTQKTPAVRVKWNKQNVKYACVSKHKERYFYKAAPATRIFEIKPTTTTAGLPTAQKVYQLSVILKRQITKISTRCQTQPSYNTRHCNPLWIQHFGTNYLILNWTMIDYRMRQSQFLLTTPISTQRHVC